MGGNIRDIRILGWLYWDIEDTQLLFGEYCEAGILGGFDGSIITITRLGYSRMDGR